MAEIRVEQRKTNRSWIWVLLLLVVLAAVAWYLYGAGVFGGAPDPGPAPTTSSGVQALRVASLLTITTGGSHGTA